MAGDQERSAGKALRERVKRSAVGRWRPAPHRADPLSILDLENEHRLADLVPVRMGRMAESPFAFMRGAAGVMAADLAGLEVAGIDVQLCGDAHVANFGLFGSPERILLFDVDDFDESAVGPFELDVLRLATSAVLAARQAGHRGADQRRAAQAAAASYRTHMAAFATVGELDLWYARVDAWAAERLVGALADAEVAAAKRRTSQRALPSLTALAPDGSRRIVDHPPLVVHEGSDLPGTPGTLVDAYRKSLADVVGRLVDRFDPVDAARKVVGVGSVGTRCLILLLMGAAGDGLLLQVKEARASVLTAGLGRRPAGGWGRRVVDGQRLMQSASDLFLGWASVDGVDFYVRQLRDMKGSIDATALAPPALAAYAELCGWTLARAHARAGGRSLAARIAGYLGSGTTFDDAASSFAETYADVTSADHAALVAAAEAGRVSIRTGV